MERLHKLHAQNELLREKVSALEQKVADYAALAFVKGWHSDVPSYHQTLGLKR
jgi:hypothetical protein